MQPILKYISNNNHLNKILELSEKHGFFKCILHNNNTINHINIGPNGALLSENLRNEWLISSIINNNHSMYLNTNDCKINIFNYAKNLNQDRLPFGIASIIQNKDASKFLHSIYVSSTNSLQFFHQWQRQRRMWWRKFSASPGRYILTDPKIESNNEQNIQISSEYSWGSHSIERISLKPYCDVNLSPELLQFKDGRKRIDSHTIETEIDTSLMLLNTICDAYDEPLYHGDPRPMLRLHRKLAPYKISFCVSSQSNIDDLNQLVLFLTKELRNSNVSILLLPPSSGKQSLEAQWKHFDQMGIPYCVILNDGTLRNGIAHLRSRDTTLKEQIHVTEFPKYVEQLFKNY